MPPYLTREVFSRCLRIIERTCMAHATPGHPDPPDKDFIVCSLDLLSGMAEGLGQSIESLVGPSNLFQLMFHCMKVGAPWPFAIAPAVRQCSCAHSPKDGLHTKYRSYPCV